MPGFQNIEDFEKENAGLIAEQEATEARRRNPPQAQPNKAKRQNIDAESLRNETLAMEEMGSTNWTGRLLGQIPENPSRDSCTKCGVQYSEQIIDHLVLNRYSHKVLIAETQIEFGADVTFSNKKAAKQYASKKAIDWLIENKHMPPGGPVSWSKVPIAQPSKKDQQGHFLPATPQSPPSFIPVQVSYASQVPPLCMALGINIPRYEIIPVTPGAPIYHCWADFGDDPVIDGRVGEFTNIHGKKNAKERVAKQVLEFLRSLEEDRRKRSEGSVDGGEDNGHGDGSVDENGEGDGEGDGKRKRSVDGTPVDEMPVKVIKIES